MDAIRKKMQSMKTEIDEMYVFVAETEGTTKDYNRVSDSLDAEMRDLSKKVQKFEARVEETMEALQASAATMEAAESSFNDIDDDVNAQSRRIMLLEEECFIQVEKLATTVSKLAVMSKEADNIVKGCRHWENITMNNEAEIEDTDKATRNAKKIEDQSQMKYDNLARSLSMIEDELKRANERVKLAEERVGVIEQDLESIGENQVQLEKSEEKARKREEKYQEQIQLINTKLKQAESRFEYAEMNISKLHHKIDELEDDIIREKTKVNAVSMQLDDTFTEMLTKY